MSVDDSPKDDTNVEVDAPKSPTEPTPTETRKRPRLDVSALTEGRDRKRGKSMFGILVGTLNKAKIEDKERNASEAARKRQLIDKKLQAKLKKETDSVRRAEEARKDKTTANRREEDLQLKDSIYKLRRKRLPVLSNFLLTSDVIPEDPLSPLKQPLAPPPRSHPPPLYYLPTILTPAQEEFLSKRRREVEEATEKEWESFVEERKTGIEEINAMRQKVADEFSRVKNGDTEDQSEMDTDGHRGEPPSATSVDAPILSKDVEMEVDDHATGKGHTKSASAAEPEKKEETSPMQADDDEAVEY